MQGCSAIELRACETFNTGTNTSRSSQVNTLLIMTYYRSERDHLASSRGRDDQDEDERARVGFVFLSLSLFSLCIIIKTRRTSMGLSFSCVAFVFVCCCLFFFSESSPPLSSSSTTHQSPAISLPHSAHYLDYF
jgi:hypothetical protein